MSYIQGPYQYRALLPPLPRPTAGTSRFIDGQTRRFELTEDGGFVDMPDTMQRVMLLLAFNVPDIGQFSTEIARAEWRKRALKALEPLTAVQPPVITNLTITMSTSRPGSDDADIDFVDNSTGRRAGVSVGATGTTVRL